MDKIIYLINNAKKNAIEKMMIAKNSRDIPDEEAREIYEKEFINYLSEALKFDDIVLKDQNENRNIKSRLKLFKKANKTFFKYDLPSTYIAGAILALLIFGTDSRFHLDLEQIKNIEEIKKAIQIIIGTTAGVYLPHVLMNYENLEEEINDNYKKLIKDLEENFNNLTQYVSKENLNLFSDTCKARTKTLKKDC